jgi:hypothetical protein
MLQYHRQIDELPIQPDIRQIRYPKLIHSGQLHPFGQVQVHFQVMLRIGGNNEASVANRQ